MTDIVVKSELGQWGEPIKGEPNYFVDPNAAPVDWQPDASLWDNINDFTAVIEGSSAIPTPMTEGKILSDESGSAIQEALNSSSKDTGDSNVATNTIGLSTPNVGGVIRMYNPTNGWGFVRSIRAGDKDIFFHQNHFKAQKPIVFITPDDPEEKKIRVTFQLDWTELKKPKALDMEIIGPDTIKDLLDTNGVQEAGKARVCLNCQSSMAWLHSKCAVCDHMYGQGKFIPGKGKSKRGTSVGLAVPCGKGVAGLNLTSQISLGSQVSGEYDVEPAAKRVKMEFQL